MKTKLNEKGFIWPLLVEWFSNSVQEMVVL